MMPAIKNINIKIRLESNERIQKTVDDNGRIKLIWSNIIIFIILHIMGFYGLYLWITSPNRIRNYFIEHCLATLSGFGTTAGAHRYWAHKCYKATLPLQVILLLLQCSAAQNSIYVWVRDHRVHHKFTETDADPHNAKRGFFFAHMGWLMCRKHPDVINKGKTVSMEDLENDPVVMFQFRHYYTMAIIFAFICPYLFFRYVVGMDPVYSFFFGTVYRYLNSLHFTWVVNSIAHLWGSKPYDKTLNPSENILVSLMAIGEGWHNYHHVFPQDYKTSELGFYRFNFTTAFIDFFAKIGWAYDLKTIPSDIVRQRAVRTGDGSHPMIQNELEHCKEQ